MKAIRNLKLVSLLLVLSATLATARDNIEPEVNAYRVVINDVNLARKIAISYHHAVLEANYQSKYLILQLSDNELSELTSLGLKVSSDEQWKQRFQDFRQRIQKSVLNQESINGADTIPGFDCYSTVEDTLKQGAELAQNYQEIAEWLDIGDSWQKVNGQGGYDLMVLKITNKAINQDKPKLFIHSSMHAREYTPAALTLDFAKLLLSGYLTSADIRWIVDYHEVHILFHMNPDGRKVAETGVSQRKNMNTNHCPGQGVGVDLNRNFAYFWNSTTNGSSGNECHATYRGVSAESEPETQAVSNYIRSLFVDSRGPLETDAAPDDTTGIHLDIHSYSQLVLWPYGHTESVSPNDSAFVALGNKLAWFNDYTPQQSIGLYPTDGTSDDVSYGELGVAAFTFELGTDFFEDCTVYRKSVKPDNLPALLYAAKAVAAPYKLAFGPEISEISLNGSSSGGVSVSRGSLLELEVTASAARSKLPSGAKRISRVEYSIDTPIWIESAVIKELTENDGDVSSPVEQMKATLDISTLQNGQHILFVRAYDGEGNVGVPSAAFINISENNSPHVDFTVQCTELQCNFDASSSSDSDGTIDQYEWDFHDGNNAVGKVVSHLYVTAGDKQVSLTVTDNTGNDAGMSKSFSINAPVVTLPVADVSSSGGGLLLWLNGLIGLLILINFRQSKAVKKGKGG